MQFCPNNIPMPNANLTPSTPPILHFHHLLLRDLRRMRSFLSVLNLCLDRLDTKTKYSFCFLTNAECEQHRWYNQRPKFEPNACLSGSVFEEQSMPGAPRPTNRNEFPEGEHGFSSATNDWITSDEPHGQPAREDGFLGDPKAKLRLDLSFWVWSYTSFASLLSPDLCRLCGPIPSTLWCPLKHTAEWSKTLPRQENIDQLGSDETLGDLDST